MLYLLSTANIMTWRNDFLLALKRGVLVVMVGTTAWKGPITSVRARV